MSVYKLSLLEHLKTVRANLAIARRAGKDRNLEIKTNEIGNLVESFLEDFKPELSELSTRYNKTEQIKKEALHASILDQKPTTGFGQDVRNKFYEFVYAKAESEESEAYKTVIQSEEREQVAPVNQ
ncbi:hypothetical protein TKK_0010300 [Trichogramma kaykai]